MTLDTLVDQPLNPEEVNLRGQAVEMFARLERSLDSVIANYYTPDHALRSYFSFDLLMSEGFSFSLRREAFEAIVRRHDWFDEKRMQHLRKAGRWRNFLAHVAGMEHHEYDAKRSPPIKVGFRDPKPPHKAVTVAEAFDQFKPACIEADVYVSEVLSKILTLDEDGNWRHIVDVPFDVE